MEKQVELRVAFMWIAYSKTYDLIGANTLELIILSPMAIPSQLTLHRAQRELVIKYRMNPLSGRPASLHPRLNSSLDISFQRTHPSRSVYGYAASQSIFTNTPVHACLRMLTIYARIILYPIDKQKVLFLPTLCI